ncbi:MAG: sugar-binding protein, partial [Candidatus Omnitrophota bacterium]
MSISLKNAAPKSFGLLFVSAMVILYLSVINAPTANAAQTDVKISSGQLLTNGIFAALTDNKPNGWVIPAGDGSTTVMPAKDEKGNSHMLYQDVSDPTWANMVQVVNNLKLTKGTTLYLSGQYYTEDLQLRNDKAILAVQVELSPDPSLPDQTKQYEIVTLEPTKDKNWKSFNRQWKLTKDISSAMVQVTYIRYTGKLRIGRLSLFAVAPGDKLTLYSFAKEAPAIDGNLDDEAWKGLQVANHFLVLGKIEKAPADVEVRSCYDRNNVYFGIKVFEPEMKNLKVGTQVWDGDCIELFLDPEAKGESHYHIIVDS